MNRKIRALLNSPSQTIEYFRTQPVHSSFAVAVNVDMRRRKHHTDPIKNTSHQKHVKGNPCEFPYTKLTAYVLALSSREGGGRGQVSNGSCSHSFISGQSCGCGEESNIRIEEKRKTDVAISCFSSVLSVLQLGNKGVWILEIA